MKVAVVTMHVKQGKCEENVSYMKQTVTTMEKAAWP